MPAALAKDCRPAKPISVIMFHGTKDPLVPYDGGDIKGGAGAGVLSAAETLRTWASLDGCPAKPETSNEPDRDPSDGTKVRRERFANCSNGSEVDLYTVEGGGHTWPGGWQYLPELVIGKTSKDIDASETIWAFFKSLPRSKR
jgi:polyhydroxybutyrate depolymerase